jgi:pre-mRNA-processing factor SLU7
MAVWGSWYSLATGQWGFACCHSTLHGSYCSGEAGIEAAEAASARKLLNPPKSLLDSHAESSKGKEKPKGNTADDPNPFKKQLGDTNVSLDREKLQQALSEEKKRKKGEMGDDAGDKRRKFNSGAGGNHDVTEEELGALYDSDPTCLTGLIHFNRGLPNAAIQLRRPNGELQGYGHLIVVFCNFVIP